jgi:calcineurin-like phosphoesterase family protein
MRTWFISDTHFLHENIKKYCNRSDDFNKTIIRNWNEVVQPEDTVFHLGDLTAGVGKVQDGYEKLKKIMNMLNGNIVLVKGNHDHYTNEQYKNDLNIKAVTDYLIQDEYFLCHYPLIIDKYTKERMIPMIEEYKRLFKESGCKYLLHGHSHMTKFGGKRINLSVDLINFTPVEITDLLKHL